MRSLWKWPHKVVYELLGSSQTCACMDMILNIIPKILRIEQKCIPMCISKTGHWVVHTWDKSKLYSKDFENRPDIESTLTEGWLEFAALIQLCRFSPNTKNNNILHNIWTDSESSDVIFKIYRIQSKINQNTKNQHIIVRWHSCWACQIKFLK